MHVALNTSRFHDGMTRLSREDETFKIALFLLSKPQNHPSQAGHLCALRGHSVLHDDVLREAAVLVLLTVRFWDLRNTVLFFPTNLPFHTHRGSAIVVSEQSTEV